MPLYDTKKYIFTKSSFAGVKFGCAWEKCKEIPLLALMVSSVGDGRIHDHARNWIEIKTVDYHRTKQNRKSYQYRTVISKRSTVLININNKLNDNYYKSLF